MSVPLTRRLAAQCDAADLDPHTDGVHIPTHQLRALLNVAEAARRTWDTTALPYDETSVQRVYDLRDALNKLEET